MAEPKDKKNPNQKRHKRPAVSAMTPEQAAVFKAAAEKAEAERKAEEERLRLWEARVDKMTQPQLHGEIKRLIRREHVKVGKGQYEPIAGLTLVFATVFDNVLTNTKTKENPFGKLSCYLR